MDLEEWEVVPEDGFLEINEDGGKKIYSRKYIYEGNNSVVQNYFSCSTPNPTQFVDSTIVQKQITIPIQVQLEPKIDEEVTKQVISSSEEVPFEINMLPSTISEKIKTPRVMETEQDQVSQVFFKKMNKESENRVLLESPKSGNSSKNLVPQIDAVATTFKFEEKIEKENNGEVEMEDEKGGLKVLMNGVGAICSFGVAAAATICIIFIGNRQKHKQNQMLRFQLFSHDKRMKQVVEHASKLSEAMSAVRGVPIARAHITVGGYYDAV